jgi:hypothetical protein
MEAARRGAGLILALAALAGCGGSNDDNRDMTAVARLESEPGAAAKRKLVVAK